MRRYLLHPGMGPRGLQLTRGEPEPLGPFDVRMRVHAVALNARDTFLAGLQRAAQPFVPCSDAAGVVTETGAQVTRWQVGDRVAAAFYPDWEDGVPGERETASGLGGGVQPGVLAEEVVLHERAFFRLPVHMTFEEAATIPCAGVTAWNALMHAGRARAGQQVLLLGTGGVSIWALQLARAAGLCAFITSSDSAKLATATRLGAAAVINYREQPDWDGQVKRLSRGKGVDLVVEVGGHDTINRSISATRMGGTVALVGGVAGGFQLRMDPFALIDRAASLRAVRVGSRAMCEELVAFTEQAFLKPHIDRRFGFEAAPDAFEYLARGKQVGKVVVTL